MMPSYAGFVTRFCALHVSLPMAIGYECKLTSSQGQAAPWPENVEGTQEYCTTKR